jgi:hypothetical protein
MPLLLTIPCFILAVVAGFRITVMHRAHQRLWVASRQQLHSGEEGNHSNAFVLPRRPIDTGCKTTVDPEAPPHTPSMSSMAPMTSPEQSHSAGRGPISANVLSNDSPANVESRTSMSPNEYRKPHSPTSSSFPALAQVFRVTKGNTPSNPDLHEEPHDDEQASSDCDTVSSVQWQKDDISTEQQAESDHELGYGQSRRRSSTRWHSELLDYLPLPIKCFSLSIRRNVLPCVGGPAWNARWDGVRDLEAGFIPVVSLHTP